MRRRAGTLVLHEDRFLFVVLEDPLGRRFTLPPGGSIEMGEAPEDAARRETLEETGHRIELLPNSESLLTYDFRWGETLVACETHFFLAKWDQTPPQAVTDSVVKAVIWLTLAEVREALRFHPALQNHLLSRCQILLAK